MVEPRMKEGKDNENEEQMKCRVLDSMLKRKVFVVWFCCEVGLAETGDPPMVSLGKIAY
ncbi:hypothetical protein DEO72_LG10g1166 [Vigna unguiculata]|uniref:Uncharacterized protein n=1 Tax=Vigna unguiculata TaxID=3917 RepID=A0A4D6N7W9_VIGUN|nr:hypothetical protein DEO72_LG10g1166 [Vigna unguiculata]